MNRHFNMKSSNLKHLDALKSTCKTTHRSREKSLRLSVRRRIYFFSAEATSTSKRYVFAVINNLKNDKLITWFLNFNLWIVHKRNVIENSDLKNEIASWKLLVRYWIFRLCFRSYFEINNNLLSLICYRVFRLGIPFLASAVTRDKIKTIFWLLFENQRIA